MGNKCVGNNPQLPNLNQNILPLPVTTKCKVNQCTRPHQKHYCKFCNRSDSDHFSRDCVKNRFNKTDSDKNTATSNKQKYCKVKNCKFKHQKHHCKVCHKDDVDHFASNCPDGIVLYHGTKLQHVQNIRQNGFKPSINGRLGPGVYFTPDLNEAVKIAKRFKVAAAVIQCRLDEDSEFVKGGTHPHWIGVTTGQFIQYRVQSDYIKRIKIIKVHNV